MTDQSEQTIKQMFETDSLNTAPKVPSPDGKFMSLQEASNRTGLSMGTLRRYIKARKLKSRRLGRSFNSKLEVLITADMLNDQPETMEVSDVDDEIDAMVDDSDDDYSDESADLTDHPIAATVNWMQKKLDEKDEMLREKEAKIEKLRQELNGASFRNGYLEAEHKQFESKILLLEDKSKAPEEEKATAAVAPLTEKTTPWRKLSSWFLGKPE